MFKKASALAERVNIANNIPAQRKRFKKVMPGEEATDQPIANQQKAFEVQVYNPMMDAILASLSERFRGL